MPKHERKDISFSSSLSGVTSAAYIFYDAEVEPRCILQISHGMCEYILRYEEFANYLASNGVVVCGNDHVGHGESVAGQDGYGFFGEKGGRDHAINDLATMNSLVRRMYPGLPLVLFGHSMGSFFARRYAAEKPETIDALIICGTGGPNPASGPGILLSRIISVFKGDKYRSKLMQNIAFGNFLRRIPNPETPYDWVCSNREIVTAYSKDPKCTFIFTLNGFGELFNALKSVSSLDWAKKIPKDMPILMIQGDADPVGNYGKGTAVVRDMLIEAGVKNIEYIVYPGMRHEIVNETGRDQVYKDVLQFVDVVTKNITAK